MLRLRDDQWDRIREHFLEEHVPDSRPGRKPVPTRVVLEAVLWILNTGAQWHFLPQCYPNYKAVHRRFQQWGQPGACHGHLLIAEIDRARLMRPLLEIWVCRMVVRPRDLLALHQHDTLGHQAPHLQHHRVQCLLARVDDADQGFRIRPSPAIVRKPVTACFRCLGSCLIDGSFRSRSRGIFHRRSHSFKIQRTSI
ncbi:MAG: transposase [Nitrospira sp.]|nr:transposase [Nitrospira sp.]